MNRGVTLIELLAVIGILALLIGATVPFSLSFYNRFQYTTGYAQTVSTLRTAQAKALGAEHSESHGVYFDVATSTITLFEGMDYASRDQLYDFSIDLQEVNLSTSFGSSIVFSEATGLPSTTGTVTITTDAGNAQVIINDEGLIE